MNRHFSFEECLLFLSKTIDIFNKIEYNLIGRDICERESVMKAFTNIVLKRIINFSISLVLIVLLFLIIRYIAVPISRPFSSVHP